MEKSKILRKITHLIKIFIGPFLIFFVLLVLFIPSVNASSSTSSVAYKELSLHYSATSNKGVKNKWTTYYYTPTMPTGIKNFVGLSGEITVSGDSNNDGLILIRIINDTSGGCPPTGQYHFTGDDSFYHFPHPVGLASYILKINQPGSVTVPTKFILPLKKPISGCVSLLINGGEPKYGSPIKTVSNVTLLYDTDSTVSSSPHIVGMGAEFCIGRSPGNGCSVSSETVSLSQAFALVRKITRNSKLWSLFGNLGTAGNRIAVSTPCSSGSWTTITDLYVYKEKDCPADGFLGPSESLAQIPTSALKLFTTTINGNKCVGDLQSPGRDFEPPIEIKANDCLVLVQRFNAKGALAAETQVETLLEYITPTPTKIPTKTPTPGPSNTIVPTSATCTKKTKGDANCDNSITLTDFEIWRSEFIKNALTKADFNDDRKINLFDFEIWRGNIK